MGSNSNRTERYNIERYSQDRTSNKRDYRQSQSKLDSDARLRGEIGEYKANQIIKSFDDLKSRGLI